MNDANKLIDMKRVGKYRMVCIAEYMVAREFCRK